MERKAPESPKLLRSKCVFLQNKSMVKLCTWQSDSPARKPIRKDRDRDLEKFTKGECWLMFATDVTCRHQFFASKMGCRVFVESHYSGWIFATDPRSTAAIWMKYSDFFYILVAACSHYGLKQLEAILPSFWVLLFRKFSAKCATDRSLNCKTCSYMECLHIV